jgi:hypothetical protein
MFRVCNVGGFALAERFRVMLAAGGMFGFVGRAAGVATFDGPDMNGSGGFAIVGNDGRSLSSSSDSIVKSTTPLRQSLPGHMLVIGGA